MQAQCHVWKINRVIAGWLVACVGLAAIGFAADTASQPAQMSFQVTIDGQERVATVGVIMRGETAYVPLRDLVSKLGGGYRAFPDRIQVDLVKQTAWMRVDDNQVDASLNRFLLNRPVLRDGENMLMSAQDIAPFMEKAFRLTAKAAKAAPAPLPDANSLMAQEGAPSTPQPAPTAQETAQPVPSPLPVEEVPLPAEAAAPPSPQTLEPVELPPPVPAPAEPLPVLPPTPEATPQTPPAETPLPEPPSTPPAPEPVPTQEPPAPHVRGPVKVVVIDAGHGGNDTGCEGPGGGKEKDFTLAVALRLEEQLTQLTNLTVKLTRREDTEVLLRQRIATVAKDKGDLIISLHCGGALAGAMRGVGVFHTQGAAADNGAMDERVAPANAVAGQIAIAIAETASVENRGPRSAPCAMLEGVNVPGVLVEMGFLTNADDEALLRSETYQGQVAAGIAAGIQRFVTGPKPSEAAQ